MPVKKIKISRSDMLFAGVAIFIIGFITGGIILVNSDKTGGFTLLPAPVTDERSVIALLPAVDSDGNGVIAILNTTVRSGTGKIFIDTSNVLNYVDTQFSARTAAQVAAKYARVDINRVDVEYAMHTNATMIEGPSAGASMAISVLMAMKNKTEPGNVAITGTINDDGTIGQVGAVMEKAKVAKENGITTFLVPVGQSNTDDSQRTKSCSMTGGVQVCRVNYQTRAVDIGKTLDIGVYEVADIGDAFKYYANETA